MKDTAKTQSARFDTANVKTGPAILTTSNGKHSPKERFQTAIRAFGTARETFVAIVKELLGKNPSQTKQDKVRAECVEWAKEIYEEGTARAYVSYALRACGIRKRNTEKGKTRYSKECIALARRVLKECKGEKDKAAGRLLSASRYLKSLRD